MRSNLKSRKRIKPKTLNAIDKRVLSGQSKKLAGRALAEGVPPLGFARHNDGCPPTGFLRIDYELNG